MNRLFLAGLLLAATCCAGSCGSRSSKPSAADGMQADNAAIAPADSSLQVTPTYAEGYTIDYRADGVRLLDVHDPQNPEAPGYHFALVPRGTHPAGIPQDYTRCPAAQTARPGPRADVSPRPSFPLGIST